MTDAARPKADAERRTAVEAGEADTRSTALPRPESALPRPESALARGPARRRSPPWHPAFVHFPLACWVLATLFGIAALARLSLPSALNLSDPAAVSVLLLWLGLATSVPAVGVGLVDYANLPVAVRDSREMLRHVAWMGAAWLLFLVSALLRVAEDGVPAPYFTAIEVLGTVCLVAGGHFAAVVVFERLPAAAADARSSDRDLST